MKDLDRLRVSGDAGERALLRAADPIVPPRAPERVLRRIEERLAREARGGLPRVAWALLALLAAGPALAYAVKRTGDARGAAGERAAAAATGQAARTPAAGAPATAPDPGAPPTAPEESAPRPATAEPRAQKPRREPAPATAPATAGPTTGAAPAAPVPAPPAPPGGIPPAPAAAAPTQPSRLSITREGRRDVALAVSDGRVWGDVRGTRVWLEIKPAEIAGKIDDERVWLWLRGESADGDMAGYPSGFVLRPTRRGHILRGSIPGQSVRLELGPGVLSWSPGCERDLPAVGPGVYEGVCASGKKARVVLPEAMQRLPPLPRAFVLGVLLTEKDPVFDDERPRLFPPEGR
jgi:hypothetical protein